MTTKQANEAKRAADPAKNTTAPAPAFTETTPLYNREGVILTLELKVMPNSDREIPGIIILPIDNARTDHFKEYMRTILTEREYKAACEILDAVVSEACKPSHHPKNKHNYARVRVVL